MSGSKAVETAVVGDNIPGVVRRRGAKCLGIPRVLVAVEVQVLKVDAELGRHEVGDDRFEVLALDVLAQRLLGDLPRQADSGAGVLDLAGLHAGAVSVVRVLGLLPQDAPGNADLIDLARLCGAHFVANQRAEVGGLEGLLQKLPRLLRVKQTAAGERGRLDGRFADDAAVVVSHGVLSSYSFY